MKREQLCPSIEFLADTCAEFSRKRSKLNGLEVQHNAAKERLVTVEAEYNEAYESLEACLINLRNYFTNSPISEGVKRELAPKEAESESLGREI